MEGVCRRLFVAREKSDNDRGENTKQGKAGDEVDTKTINLTSLPPGFSLINVIAQKVVNFC